MPAAPQGRTLEDEQASLIARMVKEEVSSSNYLIATWSTLSVVVVVAGGSTAQTGSSTPDSWKTRLTGPRLQAVCCV